MGKVFLISIQNSEFKQNMNDKWNYIKSKKKKEIRDDEVGMDKGSLSTYHSIFP